MVQQQPGPAFILGPDRDKDRKDKLKAEMQAEYQRFLENERHRGRLRKKGGIDDEPETNPYRGDVQKRLEERLQAGEREVEERNRIHMRQGPGLRHMHDGSPDDVQRRRLLEDERRRHYAAELQRQIELKKAGSFPSPRAGGPGGAPAAASLELQGGYSPRPFGGPAMGYAPNNANNTSFPPPGAQPPQQPARLPGREFFEDPEHSTAALQARIDQILEERLARAGQPPPSYAAPLHPHAPQLPPQYGPPPPQGGGYAAYLDGYGPGPSQPPPQQPFGMVQRSFAEEGPPQPMRGVIPPPGPPPGYGPGPQGGGGGGPRMAQIGGAPADRGVEMDRRRAYARELEDQMRLNKEKKEREKVVRRAEDSRIEAQAAALNPFGRGGGGAPLRDGQGHVISDLKDAHRQAQLGLPSMQPPPHMGGPPHAQPMPEYLSGPGGGPGMPMGGPGGYGGGGPAPPPGMMMMDGGGGGGGGPPGPGRVPEEPVFRFRTDNAFMTRSEMENRQRAQAEMQDALKRQIDEKKRREAEAKRKAEEDELRREARFKAEQEEMRQRQAAEQAAQRSKAHKEEAQTEVERKWMEAKAAAEAEKVAKKQAKARRVSGGVGGDDPLPEPAQRRVAPGPEPEDEDFAAEGGVMIKMPRRKQVAAAVPPPSPPPLQARLERAHSRQGPRPSDDDGGPPPSYLPARPRAHDRDRYDDENEYDDRDHDAAARYPARRPLTRESIEARAREAAQREFERLRGALAEEAERLRQVLSRQEREMSQLKDRATRAEREGERVKAELWELQIDRAREPTYPAAAQQYDPASYMGLGDDIPLPSDDNFLGLDDALGTLRYRGSQSARGPRPVSSWAAANVSADPAHSLAADSTFIFPGESHNIIGTHRESGPAVGLGASMGGGASRHRPQSAASAAGPRGGGGISSLATLGAQPMPAPPSRAESDAGRIYARNEEKLRLLNRIAHEQDPDGALSIEKLDQFLLQYAVEAPSAHPAGRPRTRERYAGADEMDLSFGGEGPRVVSRPGSAAIAGRRSGVGVAPVGPAASIVQAQGGVQLGTSFASMQLRPETGYSMAADTEYVLR